MSTFPIDRKKLIPYNVLVLIRRKFSIALVIATIVVCLLLIVRTQLPESTSGSHNCRFWGFIVSDTFTWSEDLIRRQLDSLQQLGMDNPNGWGIGYLYNTGAGSAIPIIARGGPEAPLDPRFEIATDYLIRNLQTCAVAHVRKASSGSSGIPNPHPFFRFGIFRNFSMLFAHNGTIPTETLLELIAHINPFYLALNPPDYVPDYLDSDLYAIYLTEVIDVYPDSTIERCIRIAITMLDSALALNSAKCNFVMTNGTCLWALAYTKQTLPFAATPTLYYYPEKIGPSQYWVAASTPLDSLSFHWGVVPESTLITLKPGEIPTFTRVVGQRNQWPAQIQQGIRVLYPNPFRETIDIHVYLNEPPGYHTECTLTIYDMAGREVKRFSLAPLVRENHYRVSWDGTNNDGLGMPQGVYFCVFNTGDISYSRKLILLK